MESSRYYRPGGQARTCACIVLALLVVFGSFLDPAPRARAAEEVLPKHMTPAALKAVRTGLDYLARTQGGDGAWQDDRGGQAYPVAMTGLAGTAFLANGNSSTRGRYSPQVRKAIEYLLTCSTSTGLITGPTQESGRPMHGHGFALMFLACAYGSETKPALRDKTKVVIEKAVKLTAEGQVNGGWTYIPGTGDEGSVTVTQVQALRAAHNAGLGVPRGTIADAVQYIERCSTSEGGICYSLGSQGQAQLAISAAAVATLYNAGQYDAPVANRCLEYVWRHFENSKSFNKGSGHEFYCQLYAAQAFYLAGDKYWDAYFPAVRDQLIAMQDKTEGSWNGDYIGKSYGTAIALIILQLPYKYLPVYQR